MNAFWGLAMAHDALRPFVADYLAREGRERTELLDLGAAIYVACTLAHKGQYSEEYAIVSAFRGKIGAYHEKEIQESELFVQIMIALKGEVC